MARWALGYVAMSRGELDAATTDLEAALIFGTASEEIELILPPLWGLAEVALQAGDPQRAFNLCREALARAAAVGERVLLVPFVVTGVRAAQQAGRPVDAAAWMSDCTDRLAAIPDVAAAALDHGRGLVAMAEGATGVARLALESRCRRLGSARTGVGIRPGRGSTSPSVSFARTASPRPSRSPSRHAPEPIGSNRRSSPSAQRPCCGWPAGVPRTTSRGVP